MFCSHVFLNSRVKGSKPHGEVLSVATQVGTCSHQDGHSEHFQVYMAEVELSGNLPNTHEDPGAMHSTAKLKNE